MTISVDLAFAIGVGFAGAIAGFFAAWWIAVMDANDADRLLKACQAERDNLDAEAEETAKQIEELSETNKTLRATNRRQYDMLTRRTSMITRLVGERDVFHRQAEAAQAKLAAIIDITCGNYKEKVDG